MPLRTIPNTDIQYHLVCFDANGVERANDDGTMQSSIVKALVADRAAPVNDVFFCSHGWQGDVPAAIAQYDKWVAAMAVSGDMEEVAKTRPGFRPLVVGVHWPSLPYGDEAIQGKAGVLGEESEIAQLVDEFAATIADTPDARAAIRTILEAAHEDDGEREELPVAVAAAYEELLYEARLGSGSSNPGDAPGSEMGAFDANALYTQARESAGDDTESSAAVTPGVLGGGFLGKLKGLLVAPLQQMSFWKMKDRARQIGETSVHDLLVALQQAAAPTTGFHLMGHSFGCIVMSATVAGTPTGTPLVRPVDTLLLVQGALSLWSYSPDIPVADDKAGYFSRILRDKLVRGPIVTTQSKFDTCVRALYPKAAALRAQVVLGDEYPTYGGVGTFGIQGIGAIGINTTMESADHEYGFRNGRVYNLESSAVIREGSGFVGAHSDFARPEVAHAFWQAAFAST